MLNEHQDYHISSAQAVKLFWKQARSADCSLQNYPRVSSTSLSQNGSGVLHVVLNLTNFNKKVQSEVKTRAPEISKKRGQITVTRSRTHAPEIPRKRDHPWSLSLSTKSKFTSTHTKTDKGLKLMLLIKNSDWNLQYRCTQETGPISIDHALALLTKRLPILVNKTQIEMN